MNKNMNKVNKKTIQRCNAVGTCCIYEKRKEVDKDTIEVKRFEHTVTGYDKYNEVTCDPFSRYCTLYSPWRETALRGHIETRVVYQIPDGTSYEEKTTRYRGKHYDIVVNVRNTVSYEAR